MSIAVKARNNRKQAAVESDTMGRSKHSPEEDITYLILWIIELAARRQEQDRSVVGRDS